MFSSSSSRPAGSIIKTLVSGTSSALPKRPSPKRICVIDDYILALRKTCLNTRGVATLPLSRHNSSQLPPPLQQLHRRHHLHTSSGACSSVSLSRHTRSFSCTTATAHNMSAQLIPSNPADLMVIRNITPNIVTFSVPFSRFGKIKIGGRGTLVKLTSGTLAVFSPVALTDETKAKVTELGGNVGYIIALDFEHHIFISEWAKEYPNAKIIGPEGLPEKRAKQSKDPKINQDPFAIVFKKDNKRDIKISEEFDADFDYEYADGHANKEIVFNYKPEKVLIEADLMFNLPAIEQYSKVPESQRPGGFADKLFQGAQSTAGEATWMKRFNWYLAGKDRKSLNDSLKVIDSWDFTTLIPCHGEVIEGTAKETYRKVFQWHLEGKK